MDRKQKAFLARVDRLYSVASRVGDREVCLQAGSLVVVIRHSVPELLAAWNQFAHDLSPSGNEGHLVNHLRYFFAVMRNLRGHNAVSLLEISADVAFAIQIESRVEVSVSSVDLVA